VSASTPSPRPWAPTTGLASPAPPITTLTALVTRGHARGTLTPTMSYRELAETALRAVAIKNNGHCADVRACLLELRGSALKEGRLEIVYAVNAIKGARVQSIECLG